MKDQYNPSVFCIKTGKKIGSYMTHAWGNVQLTKFRVNQAGKVAMCMISRIRQTV